MADNRRNNGGILYTENSDTNNMPIHQQTRPSTRDFKETPKYHDKDSYVTQRHHFIGLGVFNTDELDELPPRYRDKVLKAYQKAAGNLAARYEQGLGAPTVSELIALDLDDCKTEPDTSSVKSYNSQRGGSQQSHRNQQGKFNRQNTTGTNQVPNRQNISPHSTYSNERGKSNSRFNCDSAVNEPTYSNNCDRVSPNHNVKHRKESFNRSSPHIDDFHHQQTNIRSSPLPPTSVQSSSQSRGDTFSVHQQHNVFPPQSKNNYPRSESSSSQISGPNRPGKNLSTRDKDNSIGNSRKFDAGKMEDSTGHDQRKVFERSFDSDQDRYLDRKRNEGSISSKNSRDSDKHNWQGNRFRNLEVKGNAHNEARNSRNSDNRSWNSRDSDTSSWQSEQDRHLDVKGNAHKEARNSRDFDTRSWQGDQDRNSYINGNQQIESRNSRDSDAGSWQGDRDGNSYIKGNQQIESRNSRDSDTGSRQDDRDRNSYIKGNQQMESRNSRDFDTRSWQGDREKNSYTKRNQQMESRNSRDSNTRSWQGDQDRNSFIKGNQQMESRNSRDSDTRSSKSDPDRSIESRGLKQHNISKTLKSRNEFTNQDSDANGWNNDQHQPTPAYKSERILNSNNTNNYHKADYSDTVSSDKRAYDNRDITNYSNSDNSSRHQNSRFQKDKFENSSKSSRCKSTFTKSNSSGKSHGKNSDRMEDLQNESQVFVTNTKNYDDSHQQNRTNFNNSFQSETRSQSRKDCGNSNSKKQVKHISDNHNQNIVENNKQAKPINLHCRDRLKPSNDSPGNLSFDRNEQGKRNASFNNTENNKMHRRSNSQNSNTSHLSAFTGMMSESSSYDNTEVTGDSRSTNMKRNKGSNNQGTNRSDSTSASPSKSMQKDKQLKNNRNFKNTDVRNDGRENTSPSNEASRVVLGAPPGFQNTGPHLETHRKPNQCEENGFFVRVNVSKSSNDLEFWKNFFETKLEHANFLVDYCCKFNESLILNFNNKNDASDSVHVLRAVKHRMKDVLAPHLVSISSLKYRLVKPCSCEDKMIESSLQYFQDYSEKYVREHRRKIADIKDELVQLKRKRSKKTLTDTYNELNLKDALDTLVDMEQGFQNYVTNLENKLKTFLKYLDICKLKTDFSRECNSFKRCLPVYARKAEILQLLNGHSVTVISAETGSGKTTQLAEYLLQSWVAERGTIICTQPRKIAAISVATYVCSQIGTSVGKLVGYDVGIEKKFDEDTKIIYMTDYALLKKFLRNRRLKGISCVIIDEAHERNLYTDLLLGMLKELIRPESNRLDFRIIITSATIDPTVFLRFFDFSPTAVIDVPGRAYPVKVIWKDNDVEVGWDYVKACVQTAIKIHKEEPKGDILVFLTSPSEIDDAIQKFTDMYSKPRMPDLFSLHGKSELKEQMLIFQPTPSQNRRIIFATNAAETSLTIPGIKYVIDSGMAKELIYCPEKNKNSLIVTFINKSSAEQRKGRGGRTQPGVCYRLYSKKNFEEMPERACPEILNTNLLKALLKIYQLGIQPESFDFVESPSKEAITRSLESLEHLGFVENHALTKLGKKVVELPVDPRLSKLILEGINSEIGYEAIIMAAMVSEAGRLFVRGEDSKLEADKKKIKFCVDTGDLCTYLEVYKRWREVARSDRFNWCMENFVSSKAMKAATKTIEEILISLQQELGIRVIRRYNNNTFLAKYESIIFSALSENLCIFSGHAKVGYFSPYFRENLYIHPSSSLNYLGKDFPHFLVYSTLMQTSKNFLMDITPIKEKTLNRACQLGSFNLQPDMLKTLQILPKTIGPFGESTLIRHVLGKGGSKIMNLEMQVEKLTKSRNFKIDVSVEKGTIDLYLEKRFHEKVCGYIQVNVDVARAEMSKEEDVYKMSGGFSYFCLGAGGTISDIIMPGEFREIIINNVPYNRLENTKTNLLPSFGDLQSVKVTEVKKIHRISATYVKVLDAQKAIAELRQRNINVQSNIYVQENGEKALPIFRLQVSWNRAVCDGTGFVEFACEGDKIQASGCLAQSFYIGSNYIYFTASNVSDKELNMSNLPSTVNEQMIREKLQKALPSLIKVRKIYIRHRQVPVANEEMDKVKKQLLEMFGPFASPNNMIIDVSFPKPSSLLWNAIVHFIKPEDGERAFRRLSDNACIGIVPVQIKATRKAHLFCKKPIFHAVKSEIDHLEKKYRSTTFSFEPKYNNTIVDISFSCPNMEDLSSVRQNLVSLVQGRTLNCFGNKIYYHLFTRSGEKLVLNIQKRTQTYITLDNTRKSISVYGSRDNCLKAKDSIQALVTRAILCNKKVFNLKNSCMPSGFIKCLYVKYGLDLEGLISAFNLKTAFLDTVEGTLTIEGSKQDINRAEGHLEEICVELYNKGQTVQVVEGGQESCAICLDPLNLDYYRLENCGHAFCKACLQLQVESRIIPLVCIHRNCGKEFFLIDIRKILSICGEIKKKSFYDAALQHHVNSNVGKVGYCPIPDCNTVYRITSSGAEFQCPSCENVICTHCQAPYHYGMSCDLFQNCEKDEDYSLKVWMQENANVKQCPNCKVVIEKESGCNHMECVNCETHMCWLCLETFPTGREVYDHLPFCPKNQVVTA